ncbi:hypothetical protein BDF20DRAFT_917044 [Mycotypha africana]|uniref:uncharacterized protein n=1 Tax=Mycotypha africana TaxID=64632 RepID=UPI00230094DB|nr:uncharacterized protein BDF20DRAFT_917044 [Mycotypha africana]KAI8968542.1 hypothetical protein BDF20DRAFT_917044 [Mycotypha africana]
MEKEHTYLSVQAYGVWKHAFFRRVYHSNRQGMDLTATNILDKARTYDNWMKHHSDYLERIASRQCGYGARLEFRLNCSEASSLISNVTSAQTLAKIEKCIHWYPNGELFGFVLYRLRALNALVQRVVVSKDRFTGKTLTFCSLVAFWLNSLVHREPDDSQWRPVKKLISEYQHAGSAFPFVSGLFGGSDSSYSLSVSLGSVDLKKLTGVDVPTLVEPMSSSSASAAPTVPTSSLSNDICIIQLQAQLLNMDINDNLPGFEMFNNIRVRDEVKQFIKIDHVSKSTYWCLAQHIFIGHVMISPTTVKLFSQLILTEMVTLFASWDRYGTELFDTVDKVKQIGYHFYFRQNINDLLKPDTVDFTTHSPIRKWLEEFIFPNVTSISSNFANSYYILKSGPYKKLQSRAFFINAVYQHYRQHGAMFDRFRKECIDYIM